MRRIVDWSIALAAAAASVGIWVLLVFDDHRSVGAATLEMLVKFTNLTMVLVIVVSAWLALSAAEPSGVIRRVAHLTVLVMVVVTAAVNAVLLDPALPSGWWGVVDLFQHYLIPIAVVASWAVLGPSVAMPWSRLAWILALPMAWLVLVLLRGVATDRYPYDFIDVAANGWASVLVMVVAIVALMLALGAGFVVTDRRRHRG